ncbi:importin subunit alpha [Anaeramoeba flamelloides]|uniref:Importin subunit alpha n=1 Tax=Anaeramoeba flamelloides TaxID=1746091 RepID=A0ABQ8Y8W9_9EUKA|nr:importin subunit alpha [Anaeramoeba flamelloides]
MSTFKKKLDRRQKLYKSKQTRNTSREKRKDLNVQISKNKRSEMLMKRRNIVQQSQDTKSELEVNDYIPPIQELPTLVKGVKSDDLETVQTCTQLIRKMLSIEGEPPIEEILETNIVPTFVKFLKHSENDFLKFETTWIFSNICSGNSEQTNYVVDLGVIPLFFQGIESSNSNIQIQSVWGIGNIVGDSFELRDNILNYPNSIEKIINLIENNENNIDILQNAAWTLSNLCRGKPRPPYKMVKKAVPIFCQLINSDCKKLVIDTCWGLSYLSIGSPKHIDGMLNTGIVPKILELLKHQDYRIRTPSILTIGNLVTGDNKQTQKVIEYGALDYLKTLLNDKKIQIVRETCWALSNITAGNEKQIGLVLEKDIFPEILKLLKSKVYLIKKEASWVINNAIYCGTDEQVKYLVENNVIILLSSFLDNQESKIVKTTMDSYLKILNVGKNIAEYENFNYNYYSIEMENEGIKDKFYNLVEIKNRKISLLADEILNKYFDDSESESDVSLSSDSENSNDLFEEYRFDN